MTPLEHLVTLLLCTFAAWATIGALRYDHDETTGPTRIKLAAVIIAPLLFSVIGLGTSLATVITYYLTGFAVIYLGLYSLAILLSTHRYGARTTVEDLGEHITAELQPETGRQQRRQQTRQIRTQQRTQQPRRQKSSDGTPVVFERQRR